MKSRTIGIGMALMAGLVVIVLLALAWRAQAAWRAQDFRVDASDLVARELQTARSDHPPLLTVRTYGSDRNSRDLCVYQSGRGGRPGTIWSVMYTRKLFGMVSHEQYTPRWRPAHSGGIVRDLCLHSAAEPAPAGAW